MVAVMTLSLLVAATLLAAVMDSVQSAVSSLDVCSVHSQTTSTTAGAALYVDCVNRSLTEVPASLPADTKTLDLSYNRIGRVSARHTGRLSAVELIRLQNNALSAISSDAFVNCTSLRSLYLDHNALSSMRFVAGSRVRDLHLSFNRLTTLETGGGGGVLALTAVDVSFNSLARLNCSSALRSLRRVVALNLSHNALAVLRFADAGVTAASRVRRLDVSWNRLRALTLCDDCRARALRHLDVSGNRLAALDAARWCALMPNLTTLIASDNPVGDVPARTFARCSALRTLHLARLMIDRVVAGTFAGLERRLATLRLDHNQRLAVVERGSLQSLSALRELDLRGCRLTELSFVVPASVASLRLADNPWHCDCADQPAAAAAAALSRSLADTTAVCSAPASVRGQPLHLGAAHCAPRAAERLTVWARVGSELVVDCNASRAANVTWLWRRGGHMLPMTGREADGAPDVGRRLYVESVSRATAGLYYCVTADTRRADDDSELDDDDDRVLMVVSVRLDSDVISLTTLHSIAVGLLSAAAFFLVAVVIGIVRYLAYVCSREERRKRKSIRAVVESLQDYKCAQFDRFSAYRSAKMDQLSAFKSAAVEQLSAYRDARVDRLRTYKQATVTSILAHIERMREHYAAQTARIKDNCTLQADRLRERYNTRRRGRQRGPGAVDKMRENYAVQAARIREYGVVQMARLRDQYKTQQQHVLKLVELLDVGSCVSGVIEAECMKAESMIFDADIAFDFEAQPAHAASAPAALPPAAASPGSRDAAGGSESDLSAADSSSTGSVDYCGVTACVAEVTPITLRPPPAAAAAAAAAGDVDASDDVEEMEGVLAVADDVLRQIEQLAPASAEHAGDDAHRDDDGTELEDGGAHLHRSLTASCTAAADNCSVDSLEPQAADGAVAAQQTSRV